MLKLSDMPVWIFFECDTKTQTEIYFMNTDDTQGVSWLFLCETFKVAGYLGLGEKNCSLTGSALGLWQFFSVYSSLQVIVFVYVLLEDACYVKCFVIPCGIVFISVSFCHDTDIKTN